MHRPPASQLRAFLPLLARTLTLCAVFGFPATASAAYDGSISGRVTEAVTGAPVEGIEPCATNAVEIHDQGPGASVNASGCGKTNANGEYTISELPRGYYVVAFDGLLVGYWGTSFAGGEVAVHSETDTPGIDATVERLGTIAGSITSAATGKPLAGASACAYNPSLEEGYPFGDQNCAETNSSGDYALELPPGSYKVLVESEPSLYKGAFQWYPSTSSWAAGSWVSVKAGQTTSGISSSLPLESKITGKVASAANGAPMAEVTVQAYEAESEREVATGRSNGSGEFAIEGLAPGTYKLAYLPPAAAAFQYFNGRHTWSTAEPVSVTADSVTTVAEAKLGVGGSIAGKVTKMSSSGIEDAEVCAQEPTGQHVIPYCVTANASGEYSIAGLASGSYVVEFNGRTCTPNISGVCHSYFKRQYYNQSASAQTASAVAVTEGSTTAGISDELASYIELEPLILSSTVLTGAPVVGQTLSCSSGSWSNEPTTYLYTWTRNQVPIPGQIAATYTLQPSDANKEIACEVTATNYLASNSATSNSLLVQEASSGTTQSAGGATAPVANASVTSTTTTSTTASAPTAQATSAGGQAEVRNGIAEIRLHCAGATRCAGTAELLASTVQRRSIKRGARRRVLRRRRAVVIGQANFHLSAAGTEIIAVRLTAQGIALLRHAGKRGLKVTLEGTGVRASTLLLREARTPATHKRHRRQRR